MFYVTRALAKSLCGTDSTSEDDVHNPNTKDNGTSSTTWRPLLVPLPLLTSSNLASNPDKLDPNPTVYLPTTLETLRILLALPPESKLQYIVPAAIFPKDGLDGGSDRHWRDLLDECEHGDHEERRAKGLQDFEGQA